MITISSSPLACGLGESSEIKILWLACKKVTSKDILMLKIGLKIEYVLPFSLLGITNRFVMFPSFGGSKDTPNLFDVVSGSALQTAVGCSGPSVTTFTPSWTMIYHKSDTEAYNYKQYSIFTAIMISNIISIYNNK